MERQFSKLGPKVKKMRKFLLPILIALYALALVSCDSKQAVIPNKVHCVNDLGHKKVGVQIGNTADIYASDFGGDTAKIRTS